MVELDFESMKIDPYPCGYVSTYQLTVSGTCPLSKGGGSQPATPPRRRADAVQNRARILDAARERIVASHDWKLNEIAKAAGVGQGTLYRHFPTREALLAEVYRADVDALVAAASELLAQHPPIDALALWFGELAKYAKVKRGVLAAVTAQVQSDLTGHSVGRIGEAITTLLHAGQADGRIRNDADARDVILLIGCLTSVEEADWDTQAPRLLDIVLNGLRRDR